MKSEFEINIGHEKKVLVIGLDGASWDFIMPWIEQGELPTIAKLVNGGVYGDLESTVPPWTPPAWASFMTGKYPGKHGIYNLVRRRKENYDLRPVNFRDIGTECIWDIIGRKDKKSIVINLPVTYPPPKINGIIISGVMTPPDAKDFAFPSQILAELDENVGNYLIEPSLGELEAMAKGHIERPLEIIRTRTNAALYLMKHYKYDLFILQFQLTDAILHATDDEKKILQIYKEVDRSISKLLKKIDREKTNLIILSDHGFGRYKRKLHINKWLFDLGLYMTENSGSVSDHAGKVAPKNLLFKFGITVENINHGLSRFKFEKFKRYIPKYLFRKLLKTIPKTTKSVEWGETKAYFTNPESFGIYINLEGREPNGTVKSGDEYEKIREYIIKELHKLIDPKTDKKVISKVFKREEIYRGPYVHHAPDIVFLTKNMEYLLSPHGKTLFTDTYGSSHKMNGIFIANGPDIKQGKQINGARIIDVAPTILHSLNIPIPNDIDGSVLKEIFNEGSMFAKKRVIFQDITEKDRIKKRIRVLKTKK